MPEILYSAICEPDATVCFVPDYRDAQGWHNHLTTQHGFQYQFACIDDIRIHLEFALSLSICLCRECFHNNAYVSIC
jgi:hypothetical protein